MWTQSAAIAGILASSYAMLSTVEASRRYCHLGPEISRKLLHVGMGVLSLSYPWLFRNSWPVVLLSGGYLALTALAAVNDPLRRRLSRTIYAVDRPSLGEFYFPLVVATLFILARGDVLLYCVPVAMLTIADTAAALVGARYGRIRYRLAGSRKSVEGSAAFFIAAVWIIQVPLLLHGAISPPAALGSAIAIAALATALEAISPLGLDNLLVPLACFAAMKALLAWHSIG